MCGIFCTIASSGSLYPAKCQKLCLENLKRRGPDSFGSYSLKIHENLTGFFAASVLWTQGLLGPTKQPLIDNHGNILLWNGDILNGSLKNNEECDSFTLLNEFLQSDVLSCLTQVQGPYAFIFLDRINSVLWFGRDPVGKHSLLWEATNDFLVLTSVGCTSMSSIKEVPVDGIFKLDLQSDSLQEGLLLYPWKHRMREISLVENADYYVSDKSITHCTIRTEEPCWDPQNVANDFETSGDINQVHEFMNKYSHSTDLRHNILKLTALLKNSVRIRVSTQPKMCFDCIKRNENCTHSKTAILFSGGLDSTILALISDEFVPKNEPIDLLNVAFEKISRAQEGSKKVPKKFAGTQEVQSCTFDVPDRVTGLSSYKELCDLCPNRKWNFVEINVRREELQNERSARISDLIYPLNTVLDDSLGCALWFAACGRGNLNGCCYSSPARILLLGMGADELLGGYKRHSRTLHRLGWAALCSELKAEIRNIAKRNLGRDNRVTSDHGRQPRFPFLDENVIAFLTEIPPWERCWFFNAPSTVGDKLLLRLVAWNLGLRSASLAPKKALQFGSRIADSKEKGNAPCERLDAKLPNPSNG